VLTESRQLACQQRRKKMGTVNIHRLCEECACRLQIVYVDEEKLVAVCPQCGRRITFNKSNINV